MVSHLIEVLLQGVWSSLTGGWFFDPHLSIFINTVHMYTWIFLFLFPFSIYIIFPSNFITWSIYSLTIFVAFAAIKTINYQLNKMFDKNKIIVNEKLVRMPKLKLKSNKRRRKLMRVMNHATTAAAATASSSHSMPPRLGERSLPAPPQPATSNSTVNSAIMTAMSRAHSRRRGGGGDSRAAAATTSSTKTYEVIGSPGDEAVEDNYETTMTTSHVNTRGRATNNSKKTPTAVAATDLEQLFTEGSTIAAVAAAASTTSKSRRAIASGGAARGPAAASASGDLSSLVAATKADFNCDDDDDDDDDDEVDGDENDDDDDDDDDDNYSNIRFDDATTIYEKVNLSHRKKEPVDAANIQETLFSSLDDNNVTGSNAAATSLQFNQKDVEENSNRSLFKISEESLHTGGGSGGGGKSASKGEIKSSIKSKTSSKHQKHRKHSQSTASSLNNQTATTVKKSSRDELPPPPLSLEDIYLLTMKAIGSGATVEAAKKSKSRIKRPLSPSTSATNIAFAMAKSGSGDGEERENTRLKSAGVIIPSVSFNHYEEIQKKSCSPPPQPSQQPQSNEYDLILNDSTTARLRRAQSELTFESFENIVKKAQSNFSNRFYMSDNNQNFDFKGSDLKESKTVSLITRYKTESETLEKKISTLSKSYSSNRLMASGGGGELDCVETRKEKDANNFSGQHLNASTKRLGAKSFHNLLSLSCANRRCCAPAVATLSPPPRTAGGGGGANVATSLSLSQQIQYQDLKQFKSTLECVKYLSKMQISNSIGGGGGGGRIGADRTNLSLKNLTVGATDSSNSTASRAPTFELNLDKIKKKIRDLKTVDGNDKKDDYEKQGARPKTREPTKKNSERSDPYEQLTTTGHDEKTFDTYGRVGASTSKEAIMERGKPPPVPPPSVDLSSVYIVNEKLGVVVGGDLDDDENESLREPLLMGRHPSINHRPAIRRKSSGSSSRATTLAAAATAIPTNIDDYIDLAAAAGPGGIDGRTIRFDNGSAKSKSSSSTSRRPRKDSSTSARGRRSSKYRPARGEEVGLIDDLESRSLESKRSKAPMASNDSPTSSSNKSDSDNTATISDADDDDNERLRNFHYFKDSYLKKQLPSSSSAAASKRSSSSNNARYKYSSVVSREQRTSDNDDDDDMDVISGGGVGGGGGGEKKSSVGGENEYDYIKNDDDENEDRESGVIGASGGSPSLLYKRKNHSRNRHNHHHHHHRHNNHNRLNNSSMDYQRRGGIILVSHDEIIPESADSAVAAVAASKRDSDPDALLSVAPEFINELRSPATRARLEQINSSRSRSVDNRIFDRNYAAITRRQLFRNRLRFASRLRNINLRSNQPFNTGDFRSQNNTALS